MANGESSNVVEKNAPFENCKLKTSDRFASTKFELNQPKINSWNSKNSSQFIISSNISQFYCKFDAAKFQNNTFYFSNIWYYKSPHENCWKECFTHFQLQRDGEEEKTTTQEVTMRYKKQRHAAKSECGEDIQKSSVEQNRWERERKNNDVQRKNYTPFSRGCFSRSTRTLCCTI